MIPQEVIEQIKDRDLVSIIQNEGIELKREGANYKCCCPFHSEKTPSFVVSPARNIAHCFGEGRSWDAVAFIMDLHHMTFYEAVEYLARKLNIDYEKREMTPEEREAQHEKDQLIAVNNAALDYFRDCLKNAPAAKDYCQHRGWDEKTMNLFGVGYAPARNGLLQALTSAGWKKEVLKKAGLVGISDDGRYYDAFRERIMFPIYSMSGYIAGFTGRYIGDKENVAKYKNTEETPLFTKGKALFGWYQARRSGKTHGTLVLCEGNPDVIRLHQIGVGNAIAPMGTALTQENIAYLKEQVQTIILAGDMDPSGRTAVEKQGAALIKEGFKVRVMEWDGYDADTKTGPKDPDEYFRLNRDAWEEILSTNTMDYIPWLAARKMEGKSSQSEVAAAITELCALMAEYKDAAAVEMYLDKFSKEYKHGRIWTAEFYKAKNAKEREQAEQDDKSRTMLKDYGFYIKDNSYYGAASSGTDRRWSNFILIPVLHIRDEKNARRIFVIVNNRRQEAVIKFTQSELVSFADFKTRIETAGNYIWEASAAELTQLKKYLYDDTPSANEVRQLGWQKRDGVFAWGNGCLDGEKFTPADKFGVVKLGDKLLYLPGCAADTATNAQGYQIDRKFTYQITNDISLHDYTSMLVNVFGDNAKVAMCFLIATLFKDIVTGVTESFPLLNLFGPKGTGKSALGHSLSAFFISGTNKAPNISFSTKAALADAVAEVSNAIVHLDEYKNNIELDKREFLKAIWDGTGRSKLDVENDKKRVTTAVDSGVVMSGQELPTADIALFNRVVFLSFSKTTFNDQERRNYDELKRIERRGLAHLTGELLRLRNRFQGGFRSAWDDVVQELGRKVKAYGIEDRTLKNWCTVLAAFKTIDGYVNLPFSYREMLDICANLCVDQNSKTRQNNELSGFWETMDNLVASSKIWIGVDYLIKDGSRPIKTKESKRSGGEFVPNPDRRYILINFKRIAFLYQKEGRDAQGKIIPSETLKYYLEHSSEFQGTCPSVKFKLIENQTGYINPSKTQTRVSTAMVFDYDSVSENYGVNFDIGSASDDDDFAPAPVPGPVAAPTPVQGVIPMPEPPDDLPS